jgi:hypothetical protein
MKIGRKRSLLGPPEVSQMTTDYMNEKPSGLQLDWIASKLGIASGQLQVECCKEGNWPIWSVNHFEIADVKLNTSVIAELRHHCMIPILAEQGRTKGIQPMGYLTVLAEHAFVAPVGLAICRKHNLNYLFCFPAVVDIAELQTLLAAS